MKTLTLFSLFALLNISVFAQTIRRCNNDPNVTLSLNMFRTLQEAHNAAAAGDIIYVEPSYSDISYGDLICTKTLKIIGNGYDHSLNPSIVQPFTKGRSVVGTITIKSTAIATELIGLSYSSQPYSNIEAQNVKVTGCLGFRFLLKRAATGENASGFQFLKNRDCSFRFSAYSSEPVSPGCYTPNQIENLVFKNNINTYFDYITFIGIPIGCSFPYAIVPPIKNVTISNETRRIPFYIYGQNVTLQNSILVNIAPIVLTAGSTLAASNNVCTTNCGYGNNNIENVTASSLFIIASPVYDEDFRLSPSSPAIGAGLGGINAGAFGGSDPYGISGLAPIPQITSYSKNASSGVYTTSSPMQVTISVRGNN